MRNGQLKIKKKEEKESSLKSATVRRHRDYRRRRHDTLRGWLLRRHSFVSMTGAPTPRAVTSGEHHVTVVITSLLLHHVPSLSSKFSLSEIFPSLSLRKSLSLSLSSSAKFPHFLSWNSLSLFADEKRRWSVEGLGFHKIRLAFYIPSLFKIHFN